jgi:hypothetical protein
MARSSPGLLRATASPSSRKSFPAGSRPSTSMLRILRRRWQVSRTFSPCSGCITSAGISSRSRGRHTSNIFAFSTPTSTAGREAGRSSGASSDQIRVGHQPQDCQGVGSHHPASTAGPRSGGHRISGRASDRRTHLGNPEAPECARANQGLCPPARNAPGVGRASSGGQNQNPAALMRSGFLRQASPNKDDWMMRQRPYGQC